MWLQWCFVAWKTAKSEPMGVAILRVPQKTRSKAGRGSSCKPKNWPQTKELGSIDERHETVSPRYAYSHARTQDGNPGSDKLFSTPIL
jgi:hypothetical protein